ncbi:hypothetical protein Tco_0913224 [Tanacetum coccineum]
MSASDKFRLGYGDHRFDGILSYENEVLQSVFMNNDSNTEDRTLNDRFVIADGMHAVPPPMIGNYMPSGPDIEIDDSQFTYGPKQPQSSKPDTRSSDFDSYSDDECVATPLSEQEQSRETVHEHTTSSQSPKVKKKDLNGSKFTKMGLGYGCTRKGCYVCGSFTHLIKDCDFHEKRMAKKAEMNKRVSKSTNQRDNRPIWNNVQIVNHLNQFVPSAVLTRSGRISVNTARTSGTNHDNTARQNVSTARQNSSRQSLPTRTARKISTESTKVNDNRPKTALHNVHSPTKRPFSRSTTLKTKFSNPKVSTARGKAVSVVGEIGKTVVKATAGCIWRLKRYYVNKFSKSNGGSSSRKFINTKDPLGRPKSVMAWVPKQTIVSNGLGSLKRRN